MKVKCAWVGSILCFFAMPVPILHSFIIIFHLLVGASERMEKLKEEEREEEEEREGGKWEGEAAVTGGLALNEVVCVAAAEEFSDAQRRSSLPGRNGDMQARYWSYLFDNLHRAVDEIYCTCEADESIIECQVHFAERAENVT